MPRISLFTGDDVVITLLWLGCAVAAYFAPTLIALKKRNIRAIFALNLLLGWTLVGWVVALVWSLTREEIVIVPANPVPPVMRSSVLCKSCGKYSELSSKFCSTCGAEI
jgi:Superinfection immunity protein